MTHSWERKHAHMENLPDDNFSDDNFSVGDFSSHQQRGLEVQGSILSEDSSTSQSIRKKRPMAWESTAREYHELEYSDITPDNEMISDEMISDDVAFSRHNNAETPPRESFEPQEEAENSVEQSTLAELVPSAINPEGKNSETFLASQELEQQLLASTHELKDVITSLTQHIVHLQKTAKADSELPDKRSRTIGSLLIPDPHDEQRDSPHIARMREKQEIERQRKETAKVLDDVIDFLLNLQRAALKPLLPGVLTDDEKSSQRTQETQHSIKNSFARPHNG